MPAMLRIPASAILALVFVSGCSGSSTILPSSATGVAPSTAPGTAAIIVKVPLRINLRRRNGLRPAWVSPSTKRLSIAIAGPTTVKESLQISPTAAPCAKNGASSVCTIDVQLQPGNYTATIIAYDTPSGPGIPLSVVQGVAFTIVSGQTKPVNLTLDGVPWSMRLATGVTTVLNTNYDLYGQGPHAFRVLVYDGDDNLIVGPGAPKISVSQTGGSLPLSITGPAAGSNGFTATPPAAFNSATATISIALSYGSATARVRAIKGAVCKIDATMDMQDLIAVGNGSKNTLVLYGANRTKPLAILPLPVQGGTLDFDASGNMFFVSDATDGIAEVPPPYTGAPIAIAPGATNCYSIGLDNAGNLFVLSNGQKNLVQEFAPPYTSAPKAQVGTGVDGPQAVAFDTSNDLFVTNLANNSVTEYTTPISSSSSPAATITTNIATPNAIAVNTSGTVFVDNIPTSSSTITAYAGSAPNFSQAGGVSAPGVVESMVTDASGNLFVADGKSAIDEYTTFNYPSAPATAIALQGANGVAIDSVSGTIAGSGTSVVISSAPPYTSSTTYTIGLDNPRSIAISP